MKLPPPFRGARTALLRRFEQQMVRKRFPQVTFGEGVILRGPDNFFPGAGCFIDVRAYLNCAGGDWNNYSGYIRLGNNCEIGAYCILFGAGGITIGNEVHLGALVTISANQLYHDVHDEQLRRTMQFAPVVIEDGALIGPGSTISPGVTIGRNSIVGANSAVLTSIPPNSIAQGTPARVFMRKTND